MSLSDWLVFVKERKAFFVQDAHIREVVKKLKEQLDKLGVEGSDISFKIIGVDNAILEINKIFGDKLT